MPLLTHTSTLAKHSAAIQVAGDVSLLQRRAWDMLLYHAFNELEASETHTIGVGELTRMLGITTRNSVHLRETLEGLTSTIVRWNALGKDGKRDWGASSMLAFFRVREGTIEYGFGPIRKNLHNPSMYARVRLMTTNRFTSKHALALYQLALDYAGMHQTPWMELEQFRALMGLQAGQYERWRYLRRSVIDKACEQVDEIGGLSLKLHTRKTGRAVSSVKFTIVSRESDKHLPVTVSPPDATPSILGSIHREVDPYETWLAALPPLERGALEAACESEARAANPKLAGMLLEVAVIERMRECWKSGSGVPSAK
jgi:hypothetical protein